MSLFPTDATCLQTDAKDQDDHGHITSCLSTNPTWHQRWTPVVARDRTAVPSVSLAAH